MPTIPARIAVWTGAVFFCALALSCTSAGKPAATPSVSQGGSQVPTSVLAPDQFRELLAAPLPLDSLSNSGVTSVDQARQLLLERCMSKKGFVYIDTSSASPGAPPEERFGQYLGVTNLTSAMQNGYHPSAQAKSEIDLRKSHLQSQIDNPPSPQYLAALSGPANSPGTGCIGQTSQTLGDAHGVDPTNLLGQLSDQATTSVLESGQYKTALAAWSRCMEQQGIHPPASPFDLIPQYGKTPSPTAEEIKVATADVNCKSSSGLVATFMAQERQVQARLADQNAVAIGEVRGAEQQMLDRAKQVLAAGN